MIPRQRLEHLLANGDCEANAIAIARDVDMADVVRAEGGEPVGEEQSRFAFQRGELFERSLFANGAEVLIEALVKAGVLPLGTTRFFDLRIRKHGGPLVDQAAAVSATRRLLAEVGSPSGRAELPAIVAGPALELPSRVLEGVLVLDVLVAVAPEPNAPVRLFVGEVKTYPDRAGYTDGEHLAGTRAQAGLYRHTLGAAVETMKVTARVAVQDVGFLVLSRPGSGQPRVRPNEDLRWQAERAAQALERLVKLVVAAKVLHPAPLALVRAAPTAYTESCPRFCPRADVCFRKCLESGDPRALGEGMARLLGTINLDRAVALLGGTTPRDAAETELARRLRALGA